MKKKTYLFFKTFLAIVFIVGLSLNINNLKADEIIVGQGNTTTNQNGPPFYTSWGCATGEYLITADEIAAAGGTEGVITRIGLQFKTASSSTSWNWGNFKIRMLNYSSTSLPAYSSRTAFLDGYTDVFYRTSWTGASQGQSSYAIDDWMMFTLDTPFEYTGGNLVVGICYWSSNTSNSHLGLFRATSFPTGEKCFFRYYDNVPTSNCGWLNYTTSTSYLAYRPDFKLDVEMGRNELLSVMPVKNKIYYAGQPIPTLEKPSITFVKEKSTSSNAKFTYKITRLSDNAVVYKAKNGTNDTVPTVGWGQSVTNLIANAEGTHAGANGEFLMNNPLPSEGNYRIEVKYFSASGYLKSTTTQDFRIERPLAEYLGVTPKDTTLLVVGSILSPYQYPGIVTRRVTDLAKPAKITYEIFDPNNVSVYRAQDETNGSYTIELNTDTIGKPSWKNFTMATGSCAMPNGLLNTTALRLGQYTIRVNWDDGLTPPKQIVERFNVVYEYDLGLKQIVMPVTFPDTIATQQERVLILGTEIPIEYEIVNNGVNPYTSFEFKAKIYKRATNTLVTTLIDTFKSVMNPVKPLATRQILTTKHLKTNDLGMTGDLEHFFISAEVTPLIPNNIEVDGNNNVWPRRDSLKQYFSVRKPYRVEVSEMTEPKAASYRYPYHPQFTMRNLGAIDINGVMSNLKIVFGQDTIYRVDKLVDNITALGGATLGFQKAFVPMQVGTYKFILTIELDEPIVYTYNVTVAAGLSGKYTIGKSKAGASFKTFKDALEALYTKGVGGDVVFELIDNKYVFDNNTDNPALDFRSKIVGAGPKATITFRPDSALMSASAPVLLEVANKDGYAMIFGQTLTSNIGVAPVNMVGGTEEAEYKRMFANSEGYITFDGGPQKSIEIKLMGENNKNGKGFSAPIFLTSGARNITIRNCRITGVSAHTRKAVDIPRVTYHENTASLAFEENMIVNGLETKAFSAGIVVRNRPLTNLIINNVTYKVDNVNSDNNTFEGNIINNYGYGIFSVGMGARIAQGTTIVPMYNQNNKFNGNYISNVHKAGIFLGFEKNSEVRQNRITNVIGSKDESDLLSTHGILLGEVIMDDNILDGLDLSYNNVGAVIEKNEIDKVKSNCDACGVSIAQHSFDIKLLGKKYLFPNDNVSYNVTNNMIYNINSMEASNCANRYGVAVEPLNTTGSTKDNIDNLVIANNTILINDIAPSEIAPVVSYNSVGGILIQSLTKYDIINNAIYVGIDTATKYDHVAPLVLIGQNPKKLNNNVRIENNAYYIDGLTYPDKQKVINPNSAYVRFCELDIYGRILDDGGFATEYNDLRNWTNWTGMDKKSVIYNFAKDMADVNYRLTPDVSYPRLRMKSTIHDTISLLNRGMKLDNIATDIDGVERLTTGKVFDIGALEFYSKHLVNDFEIRNIFSPAAYKNNISKFNDAEYVMLHKKEDVPVKALFRNNGQLYLANIPVTCTVSGPFSGGATSITETKYISIAVGEEKEITFFTDEGKFRPTPYSHLVSIPDDNKPLPEFAAMLTTVTPIYTIVVEVKDENYKAGDENRLNNRTTNKVRFFVPQSELNILVSTENSFAKLYDINKVAIETDQDVVAGKLNFDTVVSAFNKLGYYQSAGEATVKHDFDVLERKGWEPRSVNYSVYKAVLWADGHDKPLTYWEKQSLLNYVNSSTENRKLTFIGAGQEMLRENNDFDFDRFNIEVQDRVLRSKLPVDYLVTPVRIKGKSQNAMYVIDVDKTQYSADVKDENGNIIGKFEDEGPRPSKFKPTDTIYGRTRIAYYYYPMDATLENDKDVNVVNNISAISAKMVDKNVIYTAIDWRHLKNAGAFLAGIFNDAGDDFKKDDIILPIELVGFDATPIGRKVALNWTTASENNTSNFEVEKANVENSIIGLFSSVGTKQANGFTKSSSEYNLFDENVQYGNTYAYRLKINSFNGDYQYSPIKEVNIEYAGGASFGELTPNPASTVATMNYSLDKESNVRIALNDMTGKEIMTVFDGAVSAGSHKVSIDVTNLSTGIYHLVYIIDGKLINKPMMINVTK